MIQLAYVSRAARSLASDEVFRIIESSSRNNLRDDLTGFLIFSADRFFQVVEGPEPALEALLARLNSDERHSSIEIVSRKEIEQRSFPNWRMKRLKPDSATAGSAMSELGAGVIPPDLEQAVGAFLAPSPRSAAAH